MLSPNDIRPQSVWKHYKGNIYYVFQIASLIGTRDMREGQKFALWVAVYERVTGNFVTHVRCGLSEHYGGDGVMLLGHADYTGEPRLVVPDDPLVVYIGLYNNPKGNRFCMRPVAEWGEMVDVPAPMERGPDDDYHECGPPSCVQRYVPVVG